MGAAVTDIQAALDTYGKGIKIIKSDTLSASVDSFLCTGGTEAPGRQRWCNTTSSQTAAQQATAIRAVMLREQG